MKQNSERLPVTHMHLAACVDSSDDICDCKLASLFRKDDDRKIATTTISHQPGFVNYDGDAL